MDRGKASGVTLCAVTSVARDATLAAMRHSLSQLQFDRALLLSDSCPPGIDETDIEWRRIAPLKSREDYSRFILHELAYYIDSRHVLIVQWDGFVRDGRRWQDAFLDYDYIGAPWPHFLDGASVGNGGFSLRSKRLLEATRTIPPGSEPEDILICRTYRQKLETVDGLRFAGLEIASQFSYERICSTGLEFGFHGAYNLFAELPDSMFRSLISSIEPGVVGPGESVQLMLAAVARFDLAIVQLALKHVLAHPQVIRRIILGVRQALGGWQPKGLADRARERSK
jgi:hypothetical protein